MKAHAAARLVLALLPLSLFQACLQDPEPPPVPWLAYHLPNPYLPLGYQMAADVWVEHGKAEEWVIELREGPPGLTLKGSRPMPEGVIGPAKLTHVNDGSAPGEHRVRMVATHRTDGRVLEAGWAIQYRPEADRGVTIRMEGCPLWVTVGRTLRCSVFISDPEGDSLKFFHELPTGVIYRPPLIEWTPGPQAVGYQQFVFYVRDVWGKDIRDVVAFQVLATDSKRYSASHDVGRRWWIEGYRARPLGTGRDSVRLRRSVEIVERDEATGRLALRLRDTLDGASRTLRDTLVQAFSREGQGFSGLHDALHPDALPFAWAMDAKFAEPTTFSIRGTPVAALWQRNEESNRLGNSAREYVFVPGWGRVSAKIEDYSSWPGSTGLSAQSYKVWAVADP